MLDMRFRNAYIAINDRGKRNSPITQRRMTMDLKLKPHQHTEYVVRVSTRRIYSTDNATEAVNVAKATPNATITFRTEHGYYIYMKKGE